MIMETINHYRRKDWVFRDMQRAYVLFSVSLGLEDQVCEEVKKVEDVQEVFVVYGVYDLIAKIKTDSMEELKELVTHRLRRMPNVRSTLTLIQAME
jgi:DNA-binding Lrp family transcriptional regulator